MNIRLAGFGGQGIVMAGYILGHASLLDGRNALQTQSYGSESRGGACKSDVIVSQDEILDFLPPALDVLVAMSQPALDEYLPDLKCDGLLLVDGDLVAPPKGEPRALSVPATAIAEKTCGREVVANAIMLGCLASLTRVVSRDALRQSIAQSVPPKTLEMNLGALDEGFRVATEEGRRFALVQQRSVAK